MRLKRWSDMIVSSLGNIQYSDTISFIRVDILEDLEDWEELI